MLQDKQIRARSKKPAGQKKADRRDEQADVLPPHSSHQLS